MDLRIVNTCNNNCLYCLEGELRDKKKFISKDILFAKILENKKRDNITFYGGNSLLHPDILEIIEYCNTKGFSGIGLLSNTYNLDESFLSKLIEQGLKTFGFYFNSFNKINHEIVNGGGITYETYLNNIKLLSKSSLNLKLSIYINKLNIDTISRDLLILNKKFGIVKIDFIGYFPFDKPYLNRDILFYDFSEKRDKINNLFLLIKKLNLNVKFVKFSKDFFGDFTEYYNYEDGVLNEIGIEDINRLKGDDLPYCFLEDRCKYCFIKDNCKFYGI